MEQPNDNNAELLKTMNSLESENKKMQAEFNAQRAKLKELFMQKQSEFDKCQIERQALQRELDELKSQFLVADLKSENEMHLKELRAQEEISSLQQLVQDTIEESTTCKAELERIKEESIRLWQENRLLREGAQQSQQPDSTSLTPQVLSQMKKTLVRKLGGDSSSNTTAITSQDSIEQSRSKTSGSQYVHEDAEVLHSLVEQLQEEMRALKEKLREADEKLQASSVVSLAPSTTKCAELANIANCENCQKNESKLQEYMKKGVKCQEDIENLEQCLKKSRENLEKEATLRKDLDNQWQEKREAHKSEVLTLREQMKSNEQKLLDLQQKFLEAKEEIAKELFRLSNDRECVNKQLETLQADNDFLSGRFLETAEEIESRYINLPNNVEELHELILRQQNDLIQARVGSEYEKQKCVTSLDEIQILRDQLEANNRERQSYRKKAQTEIKSLQDRITEILLTLHNYETTKISLERKEAELNRQISELRVEIIELQDKNDKYNKLNTDYKAKIKNLQDELLTSEQVQKDFVKLSQTLQMALEKLRHADTEVRWQDDEDVDNCPSCKLYFTVTIRKIHCRHCGHIYCDKCLTKTVPSGPRKKIARVCDICHTLLTPNTAPYFSHENTQIS